MGIMPENRFKLFFGNEMNLRTGKLLPEATDNRGGEYNITNGTETDDENFHFVKIKNPRY